MRKTNHQSVLNCLISPKDADHSSAPNAIKCANQSVKLKWEFDSFTHSSSAERRTTQHTYAWIIKKIQMEKSGFGEQLPRTVRIELSATKFHSSHFGRLISVAARRSQIHFNRRDSAENQHSHVCVCDSCTSQSIWWVDVLDVWQRPLCCWMNMTKAASELKNQHVTFYLIRFCKKDCALFAIVVCFFLSRCSFLELFISVCVWFAPSTMKRDFWFVCSHPRRTMMSVRERDACYFDHAFLIRHWIARFCKLKMRISRN